jgi:dTDP-4-amino-4,6-dideoxygalactose transaminase
MVGTFGDAAFFSFDSTKLVNVPMKAGFVTVRDADYFERVVRLYRAEIQPMPAIHKLKLLGLGAIMVLLENHVLYRIFHWWAFARRREFTTETANLDLRLSEYYLYDMAEWQAGIALPQLRNLEELSQIRRAMYARYLHLLRHCRAFQLPPNDSSSEWACVRFPIRVTSDKLAYYQAGAAKGVDFAFSFTFLGCPRSFINAWKIADSVLDLPYYLKLSAREMDKVASVLSSLESGIADES